MNELDQLVLDLYKKYANKDLDSESVQKVKSLYGDDYDSMISDIYKKYKGQDLSSENLTKIKNLYGLTAKAQPTEQPQVGEQPQQQDESESMFGFKFASDLDQDKPWWDREVVPTETANRIYSSAAGAINPQSIGQGVLDVYQAGRGIAGLASGGLYPRIAELGEQALFGGTSQDAIDYLQKQKSEEQQAAEQAVQSAEGFGGTLQAYTENPSVIASDITRTIPSIVAGGMIGRGVTAVAPKISQAVAAGIGEGAVQAGSASEDIRTQNENRLLTGKQAALAALSGVFTGALGALGGKVAKWFGVGDIDAIGGALRKGVTTEVKAEAAKKAMNPLVAGIKGAIAETVFEELPQSAQEQIMQNFATGKKWDEGVAESLAKGLMLGSAMGGGMATTTQIAENRAIKRQIESDINNVADAGELNNEIDQQAQEIENIITSANTNETQQIVQDDKQNQTGVPSQEPIGQAPQQVEPQQEGSTEAPETGGMVQKTSEPEVTQETEKKAEEFIQAGGLRDLYNINRKLFGQGRIKSAASALIMDRMVNSMAKRAGIEKNEMYGRLKFQKASEQNIPTGVKLQLDAWHGSPYQFDKFTTEKIGTGEGAQAFGWGLYFTDLESIAENYADKLSVKYYIDEFTNKNTGKTVFALTDKNTGEPIKQYDTRKEAEDDFKKMKEGKRSLYKVSLHKGKTPDQYTWLEWDKPLTSEQINKIQKQAGKEGYQGRVSFRNGKIFYTIGNLTEEITNGKTLYRAFAGDSKYFNEKETSLFLLRAGIDGIKYPAESISRGATSDTARGFNYVVFDENAVSIEEVIKFQKDANKARGAAMVNQDGTAIIYALTDPNVSTPLHELAHVFEHYLTDAERNHVIKSAKTKGWTTETSEYFARGFEKYLATGKTTDSTLTRVFEQFKKWLLEIYNDIKNSPIDVELNPKMQAIYDSMVSEDFAKMAKQITGVQYAWNESTTTNAVAENIADYLRGKVNTKQDVQAFVNEWNKQNPKRPFSKAEVAEINKRLFASREKAEKVTLTKKELHKRLFDTFSDGAKESLQKFQSTLKDKLAKIQEEFKDVNVSPKQWKGLLNKLKNAKFTTPKGLERLNNFIDKVINDAEYADKLETANGLRNELKQLAKKKDSKQKLAEGLLTLDFAEDVDNFITQASNLISSTKPILKGYKPVKMSNISNYIDERRRVDLQNELDNLTDESEIPVEGGKIPKDKETQLGWLRYIASEKIKQLPDFKDFDLDNADAEILTKFIKLADNIIENDNHFGEDEVLRYIKVRNNIKEMFDTIVAALPAKVRPIAKKLQNEIKDLKERVAYNRRNKLPIGDIQDSITKKQQELIEVLRLQPMSKAAEVAGIYGATLSLDSIYVSESLAGEARRLIGIEAFDSAWSRVVQAMNNVWNIGVRAKLTEIASKYKTDLRDPQAQAKLKILAELAMYDEDPSAHIESVMKNIQNTINGYRGSNDERASETQKFFDKLSGLTSLQQIIDFYKQNEPAIYNVWNHLTNKVFDDNFTKRAQRNTEEVHGLLFSPLRNYLPSVRVNFDDLSLDLEQDTKQESLKQKQSEHTLSAKRVLGTNQGYNLYEFLPALEKAYEKTLYDIEVSKHQALMNEIMKQPDMQTIIGGNQNFKMFKEHLINYVNNQRGAGSIDRSKLKRGAAIAGKIGTDIAMIAGLGRISHLLTQWVSAKAGQAVHVGNFAKTLILPQEFKDEVLSLASIFSREEFEAGLNMVPLKNYTNKINSSYLDMLETIQRGTSKIARTSLTFLRAQDVNVNHTLWAAAYVKKLEDLGVKNINLAEEGKYQQEKTREQARAYASQVAATLQLETNPALRGELLGGSTDSAINFIKRIALPFAGFPIQTKNRMFRAADKLRLGMAYGDAKMVAEANKWYWSAYLESISFVAIKTAINLTAIALLKEAWDKILDDDDEERRKKKKEEISALDEYTRIVGQAAAKEALPIWTVGKAEWLADQTTNYLNYLLSGTKKPDFTSFMESDDEGPFKKKFTRTLGFSDEYGMYGSAMDVGVDFLNQTYRGGQLALDDEVTYQIYDRDVKFNKDDRDLIWATANFVAQAAPLIGLGEVQTAFKKAQTEAIKKRYESRTEKMRRKRNLRESKKPD